MHAGWKNYPYKCRAGQATSIVKVLCAVIQSCIQIYLGTLGLHQHVGSACEIVPYCVVLVQVHISLGPRPNQPQHGSLLVSHAKRYTHWINGLGTRRERFTIAYRIINDLLLTCMLFLTQQQYHHKQPPVDRPIGHIL